MLATPSLKLGVLYLQLNDISSSPKREPQHLKKNLALHWSAPTLAILNTQKLHLQTHFCSDLACLY